MAKLGSYLKWFFGEFFGGLVVALFLLAFIVISVFRSKALWGNFCYWVTIFALARFFPSATEPKAVQHLLFAGSVTGLGWLLYDTGRLADKLFSETDEAEPLADSTKQLSEAGEEGPCSDSGT